MADYGQHFFGLDRVTEAELGRLVESDEPLAILQPVGSVEPHGPHLSLVTDTVISSGAALRAAAILYERGVAVRIAPAIPYGVTECAKQFRGAISIPAEALTTFLRSVVDGYLGAGVSHVCLVNNHLEPAHDQAVRAAIAHLGDGRASVACPLSRRWARTLSAEFKSGACHAGRYETSIVMAEAPALVDEATRVGLPAVEVSLSEKLGQGISDFVEMGLDKAYAGAPADASAEEGDQLLGLLGVMVAVEVLEGLGLGTTGLAPEADG
ncbi:MAG: creatininase family protein [Deltaproteobacteria bacterium]|nr:creatininase family protein [Deltaproteobacteria bacterium]